MSSVHERNIRCEDGTCLAPAIILNNERKWFIESGRDKNASWDRFKLNNESYAREATGVIYQPYGEAEVNFDESGACTLRSKDYPIPLRDLYDPHGPKAHEWPEYRKSEVNTARHETEYQAFVDFERELAQLHAAGELTNGMMWVWDSQTDTSVLLNEELSFEEKQARLKDNGLDFHGCYFVFTYVNGKIIQGNIQNYLHPIEHGKLAQAVSSIPDYTPPMPIPTDLNLLRKIQRVENPDLTDPDALCSYINDLYEATPEVRKIQATKDLVSVEVVDASLAKVESLLHIAFFALVNMSDQDTRSPKLQKQVKAIFERWEVAFDYLHSGRELPSEVQEFLSRTQIMSHDELETIALVEMGKLKAFPHRETDVITGNIDYGMMYSAGNAFAGMERSVMSTCCGTGADWMETATYDAAAQREAYQQQIIFKQELETATKKLKELKLTPDLRITKTPCPDCKKPVKFSAKDVQAKMELKCPCGGKNCKMIDPRSLLVILQESLTAPVEKGPDSAAELAAQAS